jgi:hypothetical protein
MLIKLINKLKLTIEKIVYMLMLNLRLKNHPMILGGFLKDLF